MTKVAQLARKVGQKVMSESRNGGCCADWKAATYQHIRRQIEEGPTMTFTRV
jgi:hypothetical protein